jgi:hypothetical protein
MSPYRLGTALMRLMSEWHAGVTPPRTALPAERDLRKQGMTAEFAQAEVRRLAARSADWHLQENKLRFQRLKTLPTVRAALLHWVEERAWAGGDQLVADTLRLFLAPACPACEGRKRRVIQSRAVGSECRRCRGTGEADLPHGGRGRALLAYMRTSANQAAADMRDGAHKLRRDSKQELDRLNHRAADRREVLQRADAEAKVDEHVDATTLAEHFRMG